MTLPAVQSLVSTVSSSSALVDLVGGKQSLPSLSLLESLIEAGIESYPSWMKCNQARADLSCKPCKNLLQAHLSHLVKAQHKAATLAVKMPESAKEKHGMGIRLAVFRINNEMLMPFGNKKLSVSMVYGAPHSSEWGVWHVTKGDWEVANTPTWADAWLLMHYLMVHSVVMLHSGKGVMSSLKMKKLATTIMPGTPQEGKTTRYNHPEYIKPVKAVNNEDRRVDWLTIKSLPIGIHMQKFLIDIGMGSNKPELIHQCEWLWRFCYQSLISIRSWSWRTLLRWWLV